MEQTYDYQIVFGKCPKCGKIIERIGVFENSFGLIGYIGTNCKYCGLREKAVKDKIDYTSKSLFEGKPKIRVWRNF